MGLIANNAERLCDIVTWDKGTAAPPMAPHVLASRYEWILIFGKQGATRSIPFASWHGTLQSVYVGPPQRGNEFADIHAATFPIHLPVYVIGALCDTTKTVIDPFCGTGTTIIAAEQTGCRCYAMEIEPLYCDVAVKRWENFTGKKAELLK
jgi:DNA modification methylase